MHAGKYLWLVFFTSFLVSVARGTRISISPDGGYNDIVIKIKHSVPEENCRQILFGLKVRFIKPTIWHHKHVYRRYSSTSWQTFTTCSSYFYLNILQITHTPSSLTKCHKLKIWGITPFINSSQLRNTIHSSWYNVVGIPTEVNE